jgi:3-oxoacyl-(acyl-carrier-protein) synthase
MLNHSENVTPAPDGNGEISSSLSRVAVTGLGVASARASNVEEFWQLLKQGRPSETLFRFDDDELLAKVPGFKPKFADDTAKFAVLATQQALICAGLLETGAESVTAGDEIGLALGTFSGPIKWGLEHSFMEAAKDFLNPQVSAASSVIAYYGSLIGNVTIPFRIAGPSVIFCNLDVAGTDAIGYAYEAVRHGKTRWMLAGGADAPVNPMIEGELLRAGVPAECIRGDNGRLVDGAALVVLENYESAVARGAHIYAELRGYQTTTALRTLPFSELLFSDECETDDVECVVVGSLAPYEVNNLKSLFRTRTRSLSVTQPDQVIGYALGAVGAMQAVASIMTLNCGYVLPSAQIRFPMNESEVVTQPGTFIPIRNVLQTTQSLSRKTSVLLFSR